MSPHSVTPEPFDPNDDAAAKASLINAVNRLWGKPPAADSPSSPSAPPRTVSQKRIDANRRNAQHSTGPRTSEGKAQSRMNALKHPVTSEKLILRDDEYVNYFHRSSRLIADMRPVGAMEEQLAIEIAEHHMRLNMFSALQTNMLNLDIMEFMNYYPSNSDPNMLQTMGQVESMRIDCAGPKVFDTIGRQEGRTTRHVLRLSERLDVMQDRRMKRAKGEDTFTLESCEAYQTLLTQLNYYRKLAEEDAELDRLEAIERAAEDEARAAAQAEIDAAQAAREAEPTQVVEEEATFDVGSFRKNSYEAANALRKAEHNVAQPAAAQAKSAAKLSTFTSKRAQRRKK